MRFATGSDSHTHMLEWGAQTKFSFRGIILAWKPEQWTKTPTAIIVEIIAFHPIKSGPEAMKAGQSTTAMRVRAKSVESISLVSWEKAVGEWMRGKYLNMRVRFLIIKFYNEVPAVMYVISTHKVRTSTLFTLRRYPLMKAAARRGLAWAMWKVELVGRRAEKGCPCTKRIGERQEIKITMADLPLSYCVICKE